MPQKKEGGTDAKATISGESHSISCGGGRKKGKGGERDAAEEKGIFFPPIFWRRRRNRLLLSLKKKGDPRSPRTGSDKEKREEKTHLCFDVMKGRA